MVNIWEIISPLFFFKVIFIQKKTMKHLFNDIPEDEKNRILEMHKNHRHSEMINENPRKYVAPLVRGVGDAIRTGARALGRTLNPPKVQAIRGHRPWIMQGTPQYNNKIVLGLLDKVGVVKNNQLVQNELRDFGSELYNIKKTINSNPLFDRWTNRFTYTDKYNNLAKSSDAIEVIKRQFERVSEIMNTPIGKEVNLGFLYQQLDDIYGRVLQNPQFKPILEGKLKSAFGVLDEAISNIVSQTGL